MYYNIGDAFSVIEATAVAKLESVEVKPIGEKPANCITEYIKLAIYPDEDLDFEMKSRFGEDVKYNVRRVLHYIKDTYKPKGFFGLTTIKEPATVYEIEIYIEKVEDAKNK